jgi:hypothetical protein
MSRRRRARRFPEIDADGQGGRRRELIMMSAVSRALRELTDAEIDALYAYLAARGKALAADAQ